MVAYIHMRPPSRASEVAAATNNRISVKPQTKNSLVLKNSFVSGVRMCRRANAAASAARSWPWAYGS